MTYIFGFHPQSGGLVMVAASGMRPTPFDDEEFARKMPILPIMLFLPQYHGFGMPRSRDVPFNWDVSVLPMLYLAVGIERDGRDLPVIGASRLGSPSHDDVEDYTSDASWVFDEDSLSILYHLSLLLTYDALNPLKPVARYLAGLMPLTVAYETWRTDQEKEESAQQDRDDEDLLATGGSILATVVERVARANGEPDRPSDYATEFRNVRKSGPHDESLRTLHPFPRTIATARRDHPPTILPPL